MCEECPEGVTLKKLAETVGVTPAAASVMVDLLVKKKMLRRTRSKNDRRAVLIRLTPATEGLFAIAGESHRQSLALLEDISRLATVLLEWQRIMVAATATLRQAPVGEDDARRSREAQPEPEVVTAAEVAVAAEVVTATEAKPPQTSLA